MRRAALLMLFALAACSDPQAGIAIDARSGGVSVSPTVSGSVGGLTVAVRG